MQKSYKFKIFLRVFFSIIVVAFMSYNLLSNKNILKVKSLGKPSYTMKILDGLFCTGLAGELYLISGTEVREGSNSQVFVYNIKKNKIEAKEVIKNASCILAFCETDTLVFFATIGQKKSLGCDLYVWNKKTNKIEHCKHLEEEGVYALAWDENNSLYIATSFPARLYQFNLSSGNINIICNDFTQESYVRSMAYRDEYCYLGIGTKADFIKVNVETGKYQSLLSDNYKTEAFIYAQANATRDTGGGYILLSPSNKILAIDKNGIIQEELNEEDDKHNIHIKSQNYVELDGNILYKDSNDDSWKRLHTDYKACFIDEQGIFYGLNSSGILEITANGEIESQIDFCKYLDKSYTIPINVLAYNDNIYIPWRRFVQYNILSNRTQEFLVDTEPQAACVTEDGIYTANYTECTIWFYPFESYNLSKKATLLVDIQEQCRPYDLDISNNDKYLILGSGPLYGKFGGALSVYDLDNNHLLYTQMNIIKNHLIQQVQYSGYFENKVWLGTSPYGENTTPQYLNEPSHIVLWDILNREICLDIIPDRTAKKIPCIVEYDERIYCVTDAAILYSFDINTGKCMAINKANGIKEVIVDKERTQLLGISDTQIFEINPISLKAKAIAKDFSFLSNFVKDSVTGELYVFNETELLQLSYKK